MKYIVMECHFSYAVVLDEEGRFLKVANRQYEVGQTVTDVIEMQTQPPAPEKKKTKKWMSSFVAMAACLVLVMTSVFQLEQITYASVYMTINPEVRIDVNRKDKVVGLEGMNEDGKDLIEGYSYKKKDLNVVMDELVDRAIEMEYLHEGGQISLRFDAESDEWVVSHSETTTSHLTEYLNEKFSVTIEVQEEELEHDKITIPVSPNESEYGESVYGDSSVNDSEAESDYEAQSDYDDDDDDDSDDDSDDDGEDESNYGGYSNYDDDDDSDDDDADDDSDYGNNSYGSDAESDYETQSDYDDDDDSDDDSDDDDDDSDNDDDESDDDGSDYDDDDESDDN